MSTPTIRTVVADEVPALSALDPVEGVAQASTNFESASEQRVFAAAWDGETPLGWGILDMNDDDLSPELSHLWVAPAARRRGVGRALTTWLEKHARERGFDEVFLLVDPANGAAVTMYLDLDYSATGDHKENVDVATGTKGHHAIYRKSLTMA